MRNAHVRGPAGSCGDVVLMPHFVMKVDREQDLYVEWSTVVDDILYIGTRAWMLEHLTNEIPAGYTPQQGNSPEDRLARADEVGTTAKWYEPPPYNGAYDDTGMIVQQLGFLARGDLGKYVAAHLAGDVVAAHALLAPFEDDNDRS